VASNQTTSKFSILAADDDPSALELISLGLDDDAYTLHPASSGDQALKIWDTEKIDLAILDIHMPGKSGIEVCQEIKQHSQQNFIPVIFLTSDSGIDKVVSGLNHGADDYITKPFQIPELEARVRALLRTKALTEELTSTQAALADTEKKLVMMQVAGAAAHELGQPLTALLLQVDLLRPQLKETPQATEIFENIEQNSQKMRSILNQLKATTDYQTRDYADGTQIIRLQPDGKSPPK
jgi:DNA-binding response OmpR family regulator